ncbi:TlpA family protein disulfide reductase [Alkalihalobacillus sp. MEB130]|uniref:TlpA disulfide reductase family protein n=1 Tax=Alkalihalobacillus sp. MEB130 TaxID=2976704 RepID=UPI0028DE0238|nr:TlpA disulfide reductase family protein [Alkalihalobacillus sp. MEB130]MDT8859843.1 TlpA family protein disulfide reductase [Alkalihalobacillus sp. MEB130]
MKRGTTILVLGVVGILLIGIIFFQDRKEIGNEPGMIAENFALPMYTDDMGELWDYRGDVIILNMWASWCEPCRDEMPDLMDLQADYHDQGLNILTVNMQKSERTLQDAPNFIEEIGITLPVFFDVDGDVADRYKIFGMPMTYIINREGVIEHVIRGEVDYAGLESLMKPLL